MVPFPDARGPYFLSKYKFCGPLSGLNELVPENLLAIFDENELEVRLGKAFFESAILSVSQINVRELTLGALTDSQP